MPRKPTICVDFDGVIHSYTSPFNVRSIPDPPVPGVIEWLKSLTPHFEIVIFTTRAALPNGRELVIAYMEQHGLTWFDSERHVPNFTVTNCKPPALLYVDDRAWQFDGANFPTVDEINNFKPWNK